MDELTGEFVSETREMLERIGEALLRWEDAPGDLARVDEIFRFVHTVKGSCGFLDLPRIAALADAAETVLGDVRAGTRPADRALVNALLSIIDRIGVLASALDTPLANLPDQGDDGPLIAALVPGAPGTPVGLSKRRVEANVATARTVRVAVPLLDEIMTQLSDVVLMRNEMARAAREIDDPRLTRSLDRLTSVVGSLRDSVTRTRMQPVARVFSALPRLVRDTAAELGKLVTLEITGHDVEIDREMGEAIRDPLLHIVRNAIDHGIESPAERRAVGKPATGVLRIGASQAGNQIAIEVADDGRGIDTARLVARAVVAGRLDPATAAVLDPAAAAAMIFEPGLSTAQSVTEISGRGVGMDVVRVNVERLGGVVQIINDPGRGLSVLLRAPLTLSIVTALTVHAGGQRFAIPRGSLVEIISLASGKARLEDVAGARLAVVRGVVLPAITLARALALHGSDGGEAKLLLIVATPSGRRCAIAVDRVGDHEDLVVRAMAPQITECGLFAGQSLNEDGEPIVLLDAAALIGLAGEADEAPDAAIAAIDDPASSETIVLARAIDGCRIAVRAALVDRLVEVGEHDRLEVEGSLFLRIDGALLRAAPVRGASLPRSGPVVAMVLTDGMRQVVLPVASVDDVAPLRAIVPVASAEVEGIVEGHGEPVLLLDGLALFAHAAAAATPVRPLASIALPPSPWASALLAPMLEAAGYRVSFDRADDAALIIALDGHLNDGARYSGRAVVALRSNGAGDVAVEHYDRQKLAHAIATAREAA